MITTKQKNSTDNFSGVSFFFFFFLKSCSKIILVTWMAIIDRQSATRMAILAVEIATGTRFKVYRKMHLQTFSFGISSVTDSHWICSLFFFFFIFILFYFLLFCIALYLVFQFFSRNWRRNWDIGKGDEIKGSYTFVLSLLKF